MARRAFLHIGTAKSGTTYLQELWWRHRDALAEQGLLLPGEALRDHFHSAALVKGMTAVLAQMDDHERASWARVLADTAAWEGDVLVSHEHFSDSPAPAARTALAELGEVAEEVHVVLTVRDLARVLPSAWQQRVKQGARQPYGRFLLSVRRERADQKFWRYQDVPAILDRWGAGVPGERVHLVVVPPAGAPRDELWRRTASVLGVDVAGLDTTSQRPNDSLGIVEAELLRRVNLAIDREERTVGLARFTKGDFSRDVLSGSAPREGFVLPGDHVPWVHERAQAMVEALSGRGYDVVGDLADLLPSAPGAGRSPEDAGTDELLSAAATVVARMIERAG